MTNIFNTDISYITEQEIKDTTTKTDLKNLSNENIKILISKAENAINNYLGYSFNIDLESEKVKRDIKIACFYCVEQIFESGDLISSAPKTGTSVIVSERVGDRAINYDVGNTANNTLNTLKVLGIPEQAKVILDKYKKIFFKQKL